jgi:hypothetical protein
MMRTYERTCPLSQQQLLDLYFLEMRAKMLDVAAFLDRMERAVDTATNDDFRMVSMRQALEALAASTVDRVRTIQMILSDPTTELLDHVDHKSAFGAFNAKADGGEQ